MRNAAPLVLGISLMTLIGILSFSRMQSRVLNIWMGSGVNFDLVFAGTYLLWLVFESSVSKKELGQGKKTRDFGTCEIYALGQALTILSALWFRSRWILPGMIHILGGLIFCLGVIFRLWAIKTLGRYYSHIVREVKAHTIIDSGPYGFIRHPAYAGMILANAGVLIFFFNPQTAFFFFLILIPAILLRILVEEKTLVTINGYKEYADHKKRLIPFVW
ncbi:MAG: isoprenylcysteine carboxylmethyltransferase family protein [Desulfobacteraceae bacterium]|nr:isoprenylcysteine carboxylmethyltransferase family protein [Desulfobacteraceae bacterium]